MHLKLSGLAVVAFLGNVACGVPVDIDRTIPFKVRANGATCTTAREDIDLSTESLFQEHHKKISGVEVVSLVAVVKDPKATQDSKATKFSGTVSTVKADGSLAELATITDLAIAAGSSQEVAVNQAAADALTAQLLAAPFAASVEATGCVDQMPAGVDLDLKVGLRIMTKLVGN